MRRTRAERPHCSCRWTEDMTRLRSSFQDIQVRRCRGRATSVVMRRVLYGSRRFCIVLHFLPESMLSSESTLCINDSRYLASISLTSSSSHGRWKWKRLWRRCQPARFPLQRTYEVVYSLFLSLRGVYSASSCRGMPRKAHVATPRRWQTLGPLIVLHIASWCRSKRPGQFRHRRHMYVTTTTIRLSLLDLQ